MKHTLQGSASCQHAGKPGSGWIYIIILILAAILLLLLAAEAYICICQYIQHTNYFAASLTTEPYIIHKGGAFL